MKVKPEQLDRLVELLAKAYQDKSLVELQADRLKFVVALKDLFLKNFAEEEVIEKEAREIVATQAAGAKDIDPQRIFVLVKQRLAEKKGFIL